MSEHNKPMREIIANIIDPHSFLPDNSGDNIIADMVKQDREAALRKADKIIALTGISDAEARWADELSYLHEVADGAWGDAPRTRGLARDRLKAIAKAGGVA